jgi:hypothetical protein
MLLQCWLARTTNIVRKSTTQWNFWEEKFGIAIGYRTCWYMSYEYDSGIDWKKLSWAEPCCMFLVDSLSLALNFTYFTHVACLLRHFEFNIDFYCIFHSNFIEDLFRFLTAPIIMKNSCDRLAQFLICIAVILVSKHAPCGQLLWLECRIK